jgi:hypothetical protein
MNTKIAIGTPAACCTLALSEKGKVPFHLKKEAVLEQRR